MPDDNSKITTNDSPAAPPPAKKPRSQVERGIVWTLIAGLLVVAALQWRAHAGFSKTRDAIQLALNAVENSPGIEQRTVSVNDVPAMIFGSPEYATEPINIYLVPEWRVDTYTWRGVLKPYVLRVYFGVEGKVGNGADRQIIPSDLIRYETN